VDHVDYFSGIARESKHGPSLPVVVLIGGGGGKAAVYSNITTFSMSTFKPLTTAQVLLYLSTLYHQLHFMFGKKKKSRRRQYNWNCRYIL
jgi:hypothetical protein